MIYMLLEIFVKVFGYSMFIYGLWRLIGQQALIPTLKAIALDVRRTSYRTRLRFQVARQKKQNESHNKKRGFLYQHLYLLLASVSRSKDREPSVLNFSVLSLSLLSVTTFVVWSTGVDLGLSMIVGSVVMLVPYIFLRLALINLRLSTSKAFMSNFHAIYQSYHSAGQNAYYMLLNLANEIEERHLRIAFYKLAMQVQKNSDQQSIREATNIFAFTVKSSFAVRFGNLVYKGIAEQADLSLPLKNLNNQIGKRKQDLDNEKVAKTEVTILGWITVFLLPIFVFVAYRFTNIYNTWSIFLDDRNLTVFLIAFVMTGISFLVLLIFRKPRTDI
ncbi:hypothetical protein ACTWQB_16850 [Piscibacillus sp. B03]|uniref:hypothetical protein n=1 Tax=Piscibacillus sp. B03 TaxID=3457430 RepID=UPI003FCDAD2A